MIETAVILAAGLGSRLGDRTAEMPKGFIRIGDTTLIERSISLLFGNGIKQILIGTGHVSEYYENLASANRNIKCIKNNDFRNTGSMFTLYNMRNEIENDFLLLESDLLYEARGLKVVQENQHSDVILASGTTNSGDEVYIEVDEDNMLINMSKKRTDLGNIYAELVGISRLSYPSLVKMCEFAEEWFMNDRKLEYEYAMVGVSKGNSHLYVEKIDDYLWCEIDDENHLARAVDVIYPGIAIKENIWTK